MARDNTMRFAYSTITQTWTSVTLTSGGTCTAVTPATAPPTGTVVYFPTITVGGPTANVAYYVRDVSGATFNISVVPNGTAVVLTGTTQTAATMQVHNTLATSNVLSTRTAFVKYTSSVNHWSVSYSDALNVGRFRDQQADQSQIATVNSVVSAIANDQAVFGSTSDGNYYLRASVNVAGIFGPNNGQIIVQAAYDSATGVAPVQTDTQAWVPISNAGVVVATGSATVGTTTATAGAITVMNPLSATAPYYVVPTTTAGGLNTGTPYVVFASKVYNLGGTLASSTAATNTPMLQASIPNANATTLTVATAAGVYTSSVPVNSGDVVIVTSTALGLTLDVAYFANVTTSTGGFTLSTSIGGAIITSTTGTQAGFVYNPASLPYVAVSNTVTSGLYTTSPAGQSHGLSVGSIVVLSSGSTTSGAVIDTPYFVSTVPSPTTFTLATTLNGASVTTASAASTAVFAVGRQSRIVNVQIGKTARNYMRTVLLCNNPGNAGQGYVTFLGAELSMGRDSAQVA